MPFAPKHLVWLETPNAAEYLFQGAAVLATFDATQLAISTTLSNGNRTVA